MVASSGYAVRTPQGGKPDSVPAFTGPVIYLPSFEGYCDQPEFSRPHLRESGPLLAQEETGRLRTPIWSCSGWGLPCATAHTAARWSLTPPFHPYLPRPCGLGKRYIFCGTFHDPGSPGASPHQVFRPAGHPALWSPDFPPCRLRQSDQSPCGSDSRGKVLDQRRQYKMRPQKVQQIMFRCFFTS